MGDIAQESGDELSGTRNDGVKQEFLDTLLEMGIPEDIAIKALKKTNNVALELAVTTALELIESDSDNENWEDVCDESFKMVFVVNTSLSMGVGKIASQVAHAAVGLYRILVTSEERFKISTWVGEGEKKIVLRGSNEEHLKELTALARSCNVTYYPVVDAGLTQIAPNSYSVLGLFGSEEDVDKVTKSLKLL